MLVKPIENTTSSEALPARARLPAGIGMSPKDEAAEKPAQKTSAADLKEVATDIQENLNFISDVNLQFSIHESSGSVVVTVTDEDTGKVIREIPEKEMLDLAARLEEMVGLIFDQKM